MKKKTIIMLCAVLTLTAAAILWYNLPVDFVRLSPDEVSEIYVFNGMNGQDVHITDRENIEYIISNFGTVKLRRDGISMFRMGYRVKMTIYLADGQEAKGWNNFIINGSKVRKDPFFYEVVDGEIDAEYIEALTKASGEQVSEESAPMATEVQNEEMECG